MVERQRTLAEAAFTLSALIAVALFIGCDDVGCPIGTTQVNDRCLKTEDQVAAGADAPTAGTQAPASPEAGTSAPDVSGGTTGGGASPGTSGAAGAQAAGGVAGAQSSSPGGAAGASGAIAPSTGTPAAGSSGSASSGNPSADTGPCAGRAGELVCEQATMHHCDASGGSTSQETCTSSMLCQVGLMSGACAVCSPGTFRCTGVKLDRCTDAGQYESVDSCLSAALCNESAGMCTDMVCNPNTKSCTSDGTLKTCNADGSAFVGAGEACGRDMCDPRAGRCYRCSPGAKSCRGNSVVTCSSDGQAESEEPCRDQCRNAACVCVPRRGCDVRDCGLDDCGTSCGTCPATRAGGEATGGKCYTGSCSTTGECDTTVPIRCVADRDRDGYPASNDVREFCAARCPDGFTDPIQGQQSDCNDRDPTMFPNNPDWYLDGKDHNCSGVVELEQFDTIPWGCESACSSSGTCVQAYRKTTTADCGGMTRVCETNAACTTGSACGLRTPGYPLRCK